MAIKELDPAVADVLRFFEYEHLPEHLQAISKRFFALAHDMAARLDGPQLTNGLNRLLEAKDCFVRAALPPKQPATPSGYSHASALGAS